MAKKGIFMSVTATAVIASAFIGAESVDAASHKVKSGDNLWSLAQKYNTTVAQLKKLNELSNDMIYVNQVLEVGDDAKSTNTSTSNSSSTNKSSTSTTSGGSTYTVKSGDTLSHIAAKHGVTVNNLMSWNNLSSTNIFPGNTLTVKNGSSSSSSNSSSSNSSTTNTNTSNSSSNKGSTASGSTYTVKKGDTLGAIASKHGVSLANVMSWNNISSSSQIIYPGDKIVVKAGSSSSNSSNSSSNSSSSNKTNSNSNSSSNNSTSSSSASTYTVKKGDTLGAIASKHGVSLANVMSWNNISSSSQIIYPGDKIVVKAGSSSNNSSSSNSSSSSNTSSNSSSSNSNSSSSSNSNSSSSSASTYTVKSGDTLGAIASKHGVSLKNLMSWNNLGSSLIFPGDKLVLKEGATPPSNNNSSSNSSSSSSNTNSNSSSNVGSSKPTPPPAASGDLISTAKSVMGTPYVWGGSQPGGFDCSGFIQWAHNNSGKSIPRLSVAGYDNRSYEVSNPQVGDLVFFKGTYGGPNHMSHMGIYLGGGNFIHAGSSSGVTITNLSNSYWSKHFDSYKRFY